MSLDGIAKIERYPYEDQRYSDTELVRFRRLHNLFSSNSPEGLNLFKQEVGRLDNITRQKFYGFTKEVISHIESLYVIEPELEMRLEHLKALQNQLGINVAELVTIKETHLLPQYGTKRRNQPQRSSLVQSDARDTQKNSYK